MLGQTPPPSPPTFEGRKVMLHLDTIDLAGRLDTDGDRLVLSDVVIYSPDNADGTAVPGLAVVERFNVQWVQVID